MKRAIRPVPTSIDCDQGVSVGLAEFWKHLSPSHTLTSRKHSVWTRHADTLRLNREALATLRQHSKLYDLCSHPTQFASASLMTLVPENPQTVLGGHFDEGKAFAYEKEISSRTSLASIFPNFIYAVGRNYLGLA